jgi:hypothetical protein
MGLHQTKELLHSKRSKKYMKKCSISLVIKEIQIKIILRFHLVPVRMAIFKGNNINKSW